VICEAAARLVAILPWRWLGAAGRGVGWIAGSLFRVRRAHVEAAIKNAGIDRAPAVAARMYGSLGTALVEFLWVAGRPHRKIDDLVSLSPEARKVWDRPRAAGQGRIVVTAHTGNWDLVACAAAAHLSPSLAIVTKHLHNRLLDRFWQRCRAQRGARLVDGEALYARAAGILRGGGDVAIVIDQAPERASSVLRLPFLGRLASYDLLPAILSARTGAPIVMALGRRAEGRTHVIEIPLVIEPPRRASPAFVREATEKLNRSLDAFVRAHPEQWLWMHRRWKPVAGHVPSAAMVPRLPPRAPAW